MKKIIKILSIAVLCLYVWSCSGFHVRPGTAHFGEKLPNAVFPIEAARTGKAQLKDGVYEEYSVQGSTVKTRIILSRDQAVGDLNSDTVTDAAVILIAETGGSGTFTYLAAVINDNGSAQPVDSFFLGDRIKIQSLSIRSGEIIVKLLVRKPNEPMAVQPTVTEIKKLRLKENKLVEFE
jgi:hypothetical protein